MFDVIPSIDPSRPETWEGKLFLSFDIDWAHDDVLADTITLVEQAGVAATWFVTHDTPLLSRLRANPHFALGIHPNFNELLRGSARAGEDCDAIVESLKALVPEARVIRSHSLVQSERLVDTFHHHGLTHISNFFIPETPTRILAPWHIWDNMICVPHCWQDNVSMRLHGTMEPPSLLPSASVRVFDFHPIHVYLNSETVARYEGARAVFQHPQALALHRGDHAQGARNTLLSVLAGSK